MSVFELKALFEPFVAYFMALVLSGVATAVVTDLAKKDWVPIPAKKYPRTTAAVFSVIGTIVAVFLSDADLVMTEWWHFVIFGVGNLMVATITYLGFLQQGSKPAAKAAATKPAARKTTAKAKPKAKRKTKAKAK